MTPARPHRIEAKHQFLAVQPALRVEGIDKINGMEKRKGK
jgi:hypothetical protein